MKTNSQWPKKPIQWRDEQGVLCVSVVFTWHLPMVREWCFGIDARVGGPATKLMPNYFEDIPNIQVGGEIEGVLQRHNPQATFTSRGCIRRCGFCGVGMMEGPLRPLEDWPDLPTICDNNLFACPQSHFDRVIERLKQWGYADFNQGLDPRLLTEYHAQRLKEIGRPVIRLALDHPREYGEWDKAYQCLRRAKFPKALIRSYVLIGYDSDPSEAWQRCEWVYQNYKIKPLPMWFHALNALKRNQVTKHQEELGWNDYERRRIMQWYYQHKKAVKYENNP
jgi:hypothetical protein